jgi:hypothetical protein
MLSMMAMSCSEAPRPDFSSELDAATELPAPEYLALVSVTLTDDPNDESDSVDGSNAQVSALGTFLEYTGGSEHHVRLLSGIPERAAQRFSTGTCVRVDSLTRALASNGTLADPTEVMLLDVGNIYLETNEQKLPFDLVLVPDLPPVFAGVSYRQRQTKLNVASPSPDGTFTALVHIDALSDSDLNAISEPVVFPPPLGLAVEYDEENAILRARWDGNSQSPMELEIGFVDSAGEEVSVVCVIEDNSMLSLPLRDLDALSLPPSPPILVTARRFASSTRASGVFRDIDFEAIRTATVALPPSLP